MTAGGGQGGSQATPFAAQRLQIREARKNFLCAAQKPFAFTSLLPLARLFWAKSMFTPLPQFPRPYEPRCKPQPAAAWVKFCYLPTRPGWVSRTALYHPSPQA